MSTITTPPREVLNDLPDYYLGCLIYYDDTPDNTMRWICYDGHTKYRCISQPAAMNCAAQLNKIATDKQIGHLTLSHHFLTRAWKTLDMAAAASDIETRLWLELKSVEVRKLADALDTLISQKITKIKNS